MRAQERHVPLPPPDAKVVTTCCDYCVVGCGYKVYTWPVGTEGGPVAAENALAADFPVGVMSGKWISPNQHGLCLVDGIDHHVAILPDADATVVNRGGNHSIRGGCLALKPYHPDRPTSDRLHTPLLRVGGDLVPVSWDVAMEIMVKVSRRVLDRHGASAWAMKTFSYEFFENTYAISKLAFEAIQTPAYAPHDKPSPGNDTPGIDDSGIRPFGTAYVDWAAADVLMISGTDPFETKTVLFTEWLMHGTKMIMVLPRATAGVAHAVRNGGLFLQITPGTDTILHLAMARIILESGWQDEEFISNWVASKWEIYSGFGRGTRNTPWQWRTTWGKLGTDYAGYRNWLLANEDAGLQSAALVTGIPAAQIRQAAEMVAKPRADGTRPKASFMLEKGNYWSNNYLNTASYAALGLICGAGNRPGRRIGRAGGHQRGWSGSAASYPRALSPEKFQGRRKKEMDLDRWVEAGNVRFAWVIGTTWTAAMAASEELAATIRKLTRGSPHQATSVAGAAEALLRRVDDGGMVLVDQDIYLRDPIGSELADIVLPASGWGEHDFARCNGERRLRLYSKFADPPGEAKPDWWIIARFARKMGFEGFAWKESNDVFEEAARFSRDGVLNYHPLVWKAKREGKRGHDLLRALGTTGIQCPIRLEGGELVGTKSLHDSELVLGPPEGPTVHKKFLTTFDTHSGKAILHKSPWSLFSDFFERVKPRGDELWVTNGRINEIWQSAYDDERRPYIMQRWPENFFEIHPEDAASRGIESGDYVRIVNDDVLIQTGGFIAQEDGDLSYTALEKAGHIRIGRGKAEGVAMVTDAVKQGVVFSNFLHTDNPANSLVHRVPDPITNLYRFKLGKGRLEKIGESPYKSDFSKMSFAPRTL